MIVGVLKELWRRRRKESVKTTLTHPDQVEKTKEEEENEMATGSKEYTGEVEEKAGVGEPGSQRNEQLIHLRSGHG